MADQRVLAACGYAEVAGRYLPDVQPDANGEPLGAERDRPHLGEGLVGGIEGGEARLGAAAPTDDPVRHQPVAHELVDEATALPDRLDLRRQELLHEGCRLGPGDRAAVLLPPHWQTAAVLLGGLMIWGLQPGPLLFVEQKDFVWGLIASMYLGNLAGLIVVLTMVPLFAAILRVPFPIIAPVIVVICAIGAYTVKNNMLDVWMMVVFGAVGYVFKKLDYPLAPMVLALVLGDSAESAFRQAVLMSQGDLTVFWSNWLVGSMTTLALVLLFWPLISQGIDRIRATRPSTA